MNSDDLRILLEKLQTGTISDDERRKLEAWDQLAERQEGLTPLLTENERTELRSRLWNNIETRTNTAATVIPFSKNSKRKLYTRITAAASVLILITAGIIYYWMNRSTQPDMAVRQPIQQQDIQPGGDKAILTLADGTTVQLDNAKNGMLAIQGNATILKLDNGQIAYNIGTDQSGALQYNTITTPVGGQFKVILPDGSKVTLNAASSLHYPAQFIGGERKVTLTGEGYFEIVHNDAQPFVVSVKNIEVHDLGTEFNINAYDDEPVIQTTLVSGLANVRNGSEIVNLQPGKAARVKGADTKVDDADTGSVTAWKNGLFQFDNADIETIMRQVARWYNVEVVYEGTIARKEITGKAFRNSTLQEMLKIIELSGIHFKIEGRKIIITG
ncbi:MAG: DUF4974 domain-containing protein [Chitinophagaceae bacterium]|nr:DUF4974 domain-containing protein [Chitinophagaceae bacterium]